MFRDEDHLNALPLQALMCALKGRRAKDDKLC